ncbi:MAG: IS630 family transposase [Desulfobulbus sp.]|nr:IS630 family transposase [Desulfobulbus sp.]
MATVTISEIGKALGLNWRAAARKAVIEKWSSKQLLLSRGSQRLFPIEKLPIPIRLAVIKYAATQIEQRLELQPIAPVVKKPPKPDDNKQDHTLVLKEWQWEVFEARVGILREFENLREKNGTNNAIKMLFAMIEEDILPSPLRQYVVQANARKGSKRKMSRSSLLTWLRTVKKEGILGLIPKGMGRKKKPPWFPYIQEVVNVSPEIPAAAALKKLQEILPEGMRRPSYHQLVRALKRHSHIEKICRGNGQFFPVNTPIKKTAGFVFVTLKIDTEKPYLALKRFEEIISQRQEIDSEIRLTFSRAVKTIIPLLARQSPLCLQIPLTPQEIKQLNRYKYSKHKRDSVKAQTLLMINENATLFEIGMKTKAPKGKIYRWLREFNANRMSSIEMTMHCPEREKKIEIRHTRVLDIIHNLPTTYGINRTSWTYDTIAKAYRETFGEHCTSGMVASIVKDTGYTWRRARKVWTSPDPKYKEKIARILKTLEELKDGELFFFMDEAGPYQVKQYGGISLAAKGEVPVVPEHQKSKGSIQLIGALEARTNQVIWSFTHSKATKNIILMLGQICALYPAAPKIFVTWDAISSHGSKELYSWRDNHNKTVLEKGAGPVVELVPLPSKSQFLNVIESIFSGMKRAVGRSRCAADKPRATLIAHNEHVVISDIR